MEIVKGLGAKYVLTGFLTETCFGNLGWAGAGLGLGVGLGLGLGWGSGLGLGLVGLGLVCDWKLI